jgi:hypothetical protein
MFDPNYNHHGILQVRRLYLPAQDSNLCILNVHIRLLEENLDVLKGARKVVDTFRPRIVIASTLDKIPHPSESYVWADNQGSNMPPHVLQ